MTIAALLHHHGVHVPRYVTVGGQIVFDEVRATPAGPIHRRLGPVAAVANHTFHGGDEDEERDRPESGPAWWEDASQLDRHISAMNRAFPGFVYLPAEAGLGPCWGGVIDTGRGKFNVLIMTRRDAGLPRVAVLGLRLGVCAGKRWVPAPHLYTNGNLCVADQHDWSPDQHTVATAAAWAAHWLAAYTEWRFTRRWPVEGVQVVAA